MTPRPTSPMLCSLTSSSGTWVDTERRTLWDALAEAQAPLPQPPAFLPLGEGNWSCPPSPGASGRLSELPSETEMDNHPRVWAWCCPWPWHLCLVQHLSLGFAGLGNLLIPGMDLGNDVTEVQASVVIHGQHHGHVAGLGLQLAQLLQRRLTQCPPAPQPPFPLELQGRWARGLTLCPHSFRGQPSFTLGGIEHS